MEHRRKFLKQAGTGLAYGSYVGKAWAASIGSPSTSTSTTKPKPKPPKRVPDGITTNPSVAAVQTIDKLIASPQLINAGETAIVAWQTSNASWVALNGVAVAPSGSQSFAPSATRVYTLQADGSAP